MTRRAPSLHELDRLDTEDLWPRIQGRPAGPESGPPVSTARRLGVILAAIAIAAIGVAVPIAAFSRSQAPVTPAASTGTYLLSDFHVDRRTDPGSGSPVPGEAAVTFTERWSTDVYPGVHNCRVTVFDAKGDQIGAFETEMAHLSSPNRMPVSVPVDGSIEGATAAGTCDPERLDAPVAYETSVTHTAMTDRGLRVDYRAVTPSGLASGQEVSSQACAAAAWDQDELLTSAKFTLTAPEGDYHVYLDLGPSGGPVGTTASVTCEAFSYEGSFPQPTPSDLSTSRSDSGTASFTAQDFVDGTAPLETDLANALGLTLEGPYQSSDGTYTGKCRYFVEVEDSGAGYCLENVPGSKVDLAAISEGLRGHRITEAELQALQHNLACAQQAQQGSVSQDCYPGSSSPAAAARVQAPDLIRLTPSQAKELLDSVGLRLKVAHISTGTYRNAVVTSQTPVAGTTVEVGTTVKVTTGPS